MTEAKKTLKKEFEQAIQEGRQPNCPECGAELLVEQRQYDDIAWGWDDSEKSYLKSSDGDSDSPKCANCDMEDDNLLADSSEFPDLCRQLGLDY